MTDSNTTPITLKDSTNITAARFDEAHGQVEVEFKNGSKYTYSNITRAMVDDWQAAKSSGGWFNTTIKSNPDKYPVVSKEAGQPNDATAPAADQAAMLASSTAPKTDAAPDALKTTAPAVEKPIDQRRAALGQTPAAPMRNRNAAANEAYTERNPDQPDLGAPGLTKDDVRNAPPKIDVGKHGSKAALHTGRMYGSPTEGIAAANPDAEQALRETEDRHARHVHNRAERGVTPDPTAGAYTRAPITR
jgi:KTSC domain-containing protein